MSTNDVIIIDSSSGHTMIRWDVGRRRGGGGGDRKDSVRHGNFYTLMGMVSRLKSIQLECPALRDE